MICHRSSRRTRVRTSSKRCGPIAHWTACDGGDRAGVPRSTRRGRGGSRSGMPGRGGRRRSGSTRRSSGGRAHRRWRRRRRPAGGTPSAATWCRRGAARRSSPVAPARSTGSLVHQPACGAVPLIRSLEDSLAHWCTLTSCDVFELVGGAPVSRRPCSMVRSLEDSLAHWCTLDVMRRRSTRQRCTSEPKTVLDGSLARRLARSLVHPDVMRRAIDLGGAPMSRRPCSMVRSLEDSLAHWCTLTSCDERSPRGGAPVSRRPCLMVRSLEDSLAHWCTLTSCDAFDRGGAPVSRRPCLMVRSLEDSLTHDATSTRAWRAHAELGGEVGDAPAKVFGGAPVGHRRHQLRALIGVRLGHRAEEPGQPVELVGRPAARVVAGEQAETDPDHSVLHRESANCCSVASLSPFRPAELVNPAASLSRHRCSAHRGDVASRKALNGAEAPAM